MCRNTMANFKLQHPTKIISLGRSHREHGKRCNTNKLMQCNAQSYISQTVLLLAQKTSVKGLSLGLPFCLFVNFSNFKLLI